MPGKKLVQRNDNNSREKRNKIHQSLTRQERNPVTFPSHCPKLRHEGKSTFTILKLDCRFHERNSIFASSHIWAHSRQLIKCLMNKKNMRPEQLCCWSHVSSSPYKAVGSHILVGFIITSEFSRAVVKARTELLWRNDSHSESYHYHSVQWRNFPRGPSNTSHLQAVLLQYLLKYEKLSPAIFCLALPPGWLPEPHSISAAPAFDLAHIELQSLGLGLKATSSTYIKATLSTLPRTWETLFSKKQIHLVSRVSMRQSQVSFFPPYLFFFSVSGWAVANYIQGLKGAVTKITTSQGLFARRKSGSGLSSRNAN